MKPSKPSDNALPKRAARHAKVVVSAARLGAGVAISRIQNRGSVNHARESALFRMALGGLKGPLMKIGQLLAAIPDLLPQEYAAEFATLQSQAPSMGWPFVRRRMSAELGPDWQKQFKCFDQTASHAASLGQVHGAVHQNGRKLACKLQYPNMDSVINADLSQLKILLNIFKTFDSTVSTDNAYTEIAERLREELDYTNEARNMRLYAQMLAGIEDAHVPQPVPELSTKRLLTMTWMEGERLSEATARMDQESRNTIARTMFRLWYTPFYHYGVIHGDPHMGNYTIRKDGGINLLDFGCIRVFRPEIVQAVCLLFEALREENDEKACEAYRLWGFGTLSREHLETLNIWARFVYTPVLHDGILDLDHTNSTAQGCETVSKIYRQLKKIGGVTIPPEFVLMDRASIGLGGLFLRLGARVNWYTVFCDLTKGFDVERLRDRQTTLLADIG